MEACAITDHGNMFGALEFYKSMLANNLKPIIGSEMYLASDHTKKVKEPHGFHHIILLAKNEVGYHNLMKLSSRSFTEGFYYKPRIDKKLLSDYSEGIIAGSACLAGEIAKELRFGRYNNALKAIASYKEILGQDNFYIEIMRHGLDEQEQIDGDLIKIAKETNTPLVATNDCHFLEKAESAAHDALLCIQTGKVVTDQKRLKMESDEFYVKTPGEMLEIFSDIPYAVANSCDIASRIDLNLSLGNPTPPLYPFVGADEQDSYLEKLAVSGLEKRFKEDKIDDAIKDKYKKRLNYELSVIKNMKFPGYFLIVWDFINFSKTHNIPVGPGRGSAAGSLVAYSIRITDIDPIIYNLIFERFLNPERVSMPDIDVDISNDKRQQVIDYVVNKYGEDKTAQVITFGTMKARGVIRDVGRVLDIPYSEVDKIAKLVPDTLGITLKSALEDSKDLKSAVKTDPNAKHIFEIAKSLEGLKRHASTHAAGIVISDTPLEQTAPLYRFPNEEMAVVQYTKEYMEDINLIKFDFLGLKTLTIIDTAVNLIKSKVSGFDISKIPLDDEKTYKSMCEGHTLGMFQLESSGMQELIRKLKPHEINDVIALVALYRPGPLGSGMVNDFIKRKNGDQKVKYPLPQLENTLKETYGVILYQEQVMQIVMELAGYSAGEADVLRRAIGKKKPEIVAAERIPFVKRAIVRGVSRSKAEEIYDLMAFFAGYGFNKSHSAAYGLIAYQTAFLKANYPVEFMASILTSEQNDTSKLAKYIDECKRINIAVLSPDINISNISFTPTNNGEIRFGLGAIKHAGTAAINSILNERKNGVYKDIYDFISRVDLRKCNKKVIESLVKVGAFDKESKNRNIMLENLPDILNWAGVKKKCAGANSLFDEKEIEPTKPALIQAAETSDKQIFLWEHELLGFFLSGNPLAAYESVAKALEDTTDTENVRIAGVITEITEKTTKKQDKMAYIKIHTSIGVVNTVVFPYLYKKISSRFKISDPVVLFCQLDLENKEAKAFDMTDIDKLAKIVQKITLRFNETEINTEVLDKLDSLFKKWPGTFPVFIKLSQADKILIMRAGSSFAFKLCAESMKYLCDNFSCKIIIEHSGRKRYSGPYIKKG